jgi:hypothetical protein
LATQFPFFQQLRNIRCEPIVWPGLRLKLRSIVTFDTDINRQMPMLALSEVQPCHWQVGQTLQYAGLGGASLTSHFLERQLLEKGPAHSSERGK